MHLSRQVIIAVGLFAAVLNRFAQAGDSVAFAVGKIPISHEQLVLAPYVWKLSCEGDTTCAEATMPGAYVRGTFQGTSRVGLLIDATANVGCPPASMPVIEYSIDEGPFQVQALTRTDGLYELVLGEQLDKSGAHRVVVFFRAADLMQRRWTASTAHLRIAGFTLDHDAVVVPARRAEKLAIGYGDSITEGVGVDGLFTSWQSLAVNDARTTWLGLAAAALDCEYGQVGSGGFGVQRELELPPLTRVWDHYDATTSRLTNGLLLPEPDFVFCALGTNDFDLNITSSYVAWLHDMRRACPHSTIFCVPPPLGVHGDEIRMAVEQLQSGGDRHVHLIDLSRLQPGFRAGQGATQLAYDGVHPTVYGQAVLAAVIAAESVQCLTCVK